MGLGVKLVIQHPDGKPDYMAVVLYCDVCGEEIENHKDGIYQFWAHYGENTEEDHTLAVCHRGRCSHVWEESTKREGYLHGWMPLASMLLYLQTNLGVTQKDFKFAKEMGMV